MSVEFFITIIVGLICITVYLCNLNKTNLLKAKLKHPTPQESCDHEIETIIVSETMSEINQLSTCKKCGYQKTHYFTLFNYL